MGAGITHVLQVLRECPITTKSDFARKWADEIAEAASRGWITTQLGTRTFGRSWMVTARGLTVLERGWVQ